MASLVWAHKEGEETADDFPPTSSGLQLAIDSLAGGKGRVLVVGTVEISEVISLHSNCHLSGLGRGASVLKRANNSFTATSPAYFANMIISSAFGDNGNLNDSSDPLENITISGLTIDGNVANNTVTFTSPGLITGHYGIKMRYVDGVVLYDLEVKELLQTGIDLVSCKGYRGWGVRATNPGQYSAAASRNGFNFNNDDSAALAAGYGQDCVMSNYQCKGAKDTNITLKNVNDVALTNLQFDGALIGIEVESTAAIGSMFKNYTISNVTAKNGTGNFLRISPSAGVGFQDVLVENVVCDFHPTNHGNNIATIWSGPLFFGRTNDGYIKGVKVKNGIFRNINSFSANSENGFVLMGLPGTTPTSDIELDGLSFYGANGAEHNAANKGMDLYGNLQNIRVRDCYLNGVESTGIHVRPHSGSAVLEDLEFKGIFVDGCQEDAFKCLVDQAGASISKVEFESCRAKNPAINATSFRCFFVGCSTSTGTCESVRISQSRGWRTSSVCNGIEVHQNGSSTVDGIILDRNDFEDLGGGHSVAIRTGTPTNVYFDDYSRKGNAVASAATIVLGRGDGFNITGTTTIDTITPHTVFDQRIKRFKAASTVTFGDATGNLRLAGAWAPAGTNDSILMYYDTADAVWYELSRSGDV